MNVHKFEHVAILYYLYTYSYTFILEKTASTWEPSRLIDPVTAAHLIASRPHGGPPRHTWRRRRARNCTRENATAQKCHQELHPHRHEVLMDRARLPRHGAGRPLLVAQLHSNSPHEQRVAAWRGPGDALGRDVAAAKALGLAVPLPLLGRADELIE
jgi:hypothetical protein